MKQPAALTWRQILVTATFVFIVVSGGSAASFALWMNDISGAQVAFLGSGNRLSLLVTDGPARLLLATGDDPIAFENALSRFQPLFARRIDILLVAGDGHDLLVPLAAHRDPHIRTTATLASLPPSAEAEAFGTLSILSLPKRIRLGPSVSVTMETAWALGDEPNDTFPAWRALIERDASRIVVYSNGEAASLFPPARGAAVVAVSGPDPAAAWGAGPAISLVANAEEMTGPDMRGAFAQSARPPQWGYRVAPGEALRLRFVEGGVSLPGDAAQPLDAGTPIAALPFALWTAIARVSRRARPWRSRILPSRQRGARRRRSDRRR